ncbi:MAG: hypothetical protein ACE5HS_09285 [bacterium]
MANRLKMVQKELLFTLFSLSWSDRKINSAIGLHRATIARYRKEWQQLQKEKPPQNTQLASTDSAPNSVPCQAETVPPGQNKVPTDGVVHFEVPRDTLS